MVETQISQQAMLYDMDITVEGDTPRQFSMVYVKEDGTVRQYDSMSKGFKPKTTINATAKKNNYHLKSKGDIRLYDHNDKTTKTFKIDFITVYNGSRVV
jgi:recombination DNA repair RAD52 pathway protein